MPTGQAANLTALVKDATNRPVPNVTVQFVVSGSNSTAGNRTTDNNGQATFSYTYSGSGLATDTVLAYIDINKNGAQDGDEPSTTTRVQFVPFGCIGGASCNGVPVPSGPPPDPLANFKKWIDPLLTPAGCVLDLAQVDEIKKALKYSEQVDELGDLAELISELENRGKPIEQLLDLLTGGDCIRLIVDHLAPGQREALNQCLQDTGCTQLLIKEIEHLTSLKDTWSRADLPLVHTQSSRTWIWGPIPNTSPMLESYAEGYIANEYNTLSQDTGPSGWRTVLYFDKSRMEITRPDSDPTSQWYVTNGLLVVELIEGRAQIGDNTFINHVPADQAVAGDPVEVNPNAPTYRSFRSVAYPVNQQRAPKRKGEMVTGVLSRDGSISDNPNLARYNVTLNTYDEQLGHNIPTVFTDFFTQQGLVYDNGRYIQGQIIDWLFVVGLPISEPYWTRVNVGGVERDVLIQAFQRRVLTYSPDNAPAWRVEMGNVGQHYLRWRYGG